MKITALLENKTNREDMLTEHGLSLYIETEKHKILFDMGQSDLFAKNAAALGINLSSVDIAVLSHGHYDHGGGKIYRVGRFPHK
ncbi:MAG: MBL fold metallo-hydrolase [Lachnospiraceae bacterium]|nr:MBL fold metallo-hydrolase [Lachnospiraceae bacterium]